MTYHDSRPSTVAVWITRLLNPSVIAVAAILFLEGGPDPATSSTLAWGCLLGPGVPTIHAIVLRLKGRIPSVFIPEARERIVPLVLAAASCVVGFAIVSGSEPAYVTVLLGGYAGVALVAAVAARWQSISLHTAGAILPLATGALLVGPGYLALLPLAALVGWARIRSRGHSIAQVLSGAALGAFFGIVASLGLNL